jgi:carboxypeptidase family protein
MKRAFLLLATTLFVVSLTAWAQDTAQIVGSVTDTTGAVIPGAKVTVSNPDKGFTRELVSNSAGAYTASAIPIGNYVVTAEAQGFQKLVRSGITLEVGQIQRVDLQMTLGQVTQEVTVTGNVPKVQTETSAISDVVTGTQIANLELNGRNFVTLALLVPGAVPDNGLDTSHVGVYGNNSISFNGSRTQYNNWEIDGGNNTDEGSASTFNTYPNLDTIAEFRISTSNYGADMGKHAGATIEVATKSGTKNFHGDAFEYVRNDHFDANPWFQNRQINPPGGHAPKTPRKWNDYGYTIGGPVYIPGHYNTDKTKTFFYWSEDWRKYREGQVVSAGVPSVRMRDGDFTECDPASANFNSVAASGCTLPTVNGVTYNNINNIPGLDPQAVTNAKVLLDGLVPQPNNGVVGWVLSSSTSTNWRQEQIRVDQNVSDKTQVFVRFTQDAWNTLAVPALWTWSSYDTVKTPFGGPGKSAVLHITHSFKPNLMNEFIMGYTVDHILLFPQAGADSKGINRPNNFVANHFFPANAGNPLLPSIIICGGTPFCAAQDTGFYPWFNSNPIITWKDNVAWTRSNHTLKFGFFLEKYRKNEQFGTETQGAMHFDNWGSNTSGNALADMFLGRIQQYQEGTETANGIPVGGYPKGHWRMTAFEPFVQDDWKVSHKLTVNLGLRFYGFTRIHDVTRPTVDSGFLPGRYDPAAEAQLDASDNLIQGSGHLYTTFGNGLVQCGANGIPRGCQLANISGNWAPRFGFAYDPWGTGKTVIRGGYGWYYEMGNGNEAQTEGGEGNPPVALGPSNFNLGDSQQSGYAAIQPVFVNGAYAAPLGATGYTAIPYSQKWGSEQQFSLGLQHEFPGNNLFTVAYVGTLGRHLARNRQLNQIPIGVGTVNVPSLANANQYCDAQGNCDVQNVLINQLEPPNFFAPFRAYSGIGVKENTAVSSYHSLQANFRHAFGHGVTFQTVYTWSHAIDDSSSTYFQSGVDDYNLKRWKATSGLNRAQVLTLNYIYALPFFKNSSSAIARQALGGWEISGITSFFTGQPVDFGCGVAGFGTGIGGSLRCNSVGPVRIKQGVDNDPQFGPTPTWFDPTTVAQPLEPQLRADGEPGMFGYQSRNFLTGPGRNNTDLALLKNFNLPWFNGEHSNLQFRWETFNTFNHPQWNGINAFCNGDANADGTPAFGRNCGGHEHNLGNGQVNSAWPARIMQLGMKFIF